MKYPWRYKTPQIHPTVFRAPGSHVIGDVVMGSESSLWFNSVLRADVNYIRIGERTNIQDLTMVHLSFEGNPTIIGNDVTVGHSCVLHACTIQDFALIGMGSILLDEVEIGEYALIGAGTLITQRTKIPPRTLVLGRPGKVIRELNEKEIEEARFSANHYVQLARTYRDSTPTS